MDGKIVDSVDSDESKSSRSTPAKRIVHDVQNGSFRMLLLLKPTNSTSQSQQQLRMSVMQAYNIFVSTVRAIVRSVLG